MIPIVFYKIAAYFFVLLLFVKPLGWYMARVYQGQPTGLERILGPIERFIYAVGGIQSKQEMSWRPYLSAVLAFNLVGLLLIYLMQRVQCYLPLNPQHFQGLSPDLSFNVASSFITSTDWQAYGGENTMSYFTQMIGLTVQNFIASATGMSILVALIRGLVRDQSELLGNFWVDVTRSILYILLPLAFLLAMALCSQGVIQSLKPYQTISLMEQSPYQITTQTADGASEVKTTMRTEQVIPMGPVASQVAIKQLGANGGGFFNTNSAHPFENPTPLSNFFEMLAILLIPAALCYTFGVMVNDTRQGWAVLIAMFLLLLPAMIGVVIAEQQGHPSFTALGINQTAIVDLSPGGNMEGKETRFGIADSAIWTALTTATSNGSVNSALDSYTPLGGMAALWLMHLGEVSFGGVGSGLYGMLMLIIMTVFVTGLMVGRTPEYLGKKIDPFEMKMASVAILVMPMIVLIATAIAAVNPSGVAGIFNPSAHGFTEILYAFTSAANNNGSAFAGLNANSLFYNVLIGFVMLIGRYWIIIPVLAMAGSLARKKKIPVSLGTLQTHQPLFVVMLIGITIIIGALTFLPALCLGPIVEQILWWGQHGH